MKVRHAILEDVVGRATKFLDVTFVPALVQLEGTSFSSSYHLKRIAREKIPAILRAPIDKGYDVSWVFARMLVPHLALRRNRPKPKNFARRGIRWFDRGDAGRDCV